MKITELAREENASIYETGGVLFTVERNEWGEWVCKATEDEEPFARRHREKCARLAARVIHSRIARERIAAAAAADVAALEARLLASLPDRPRAARPSPF